MKIEDLINVDIQCWTLECGSSYKSRDVVVVVYCSWTLSTLLTYMIYDI